MKGTAMLKRRVLAVPTVVGLLMFGGGALAGATLGTATSSEAAANSVASGAVAAPAPVILPGLASTTTTTNPECAKPNQVNNGNFSQPPETSGFQTVYASAQKQNGSLIIPCWTVGGNSVDVASPGFWGVHTPGPAGSQTTGPRRAAKTARRMTV